MPQAPDATARRPIAGHLADAANLLTLAGLLASLSAILLAVRGEFEGAAIGLVLAFIFDVIDGPVARRLKGRTDTDRAFGANLDSLADMASAGVALPAVLLAYGDFRAIYLPGAFALGIAAALRLSYFNVHGLSDDSGRYTGLPTDLALIAFATLMLLDWPLATDPFRIVAYAGAVTLAALMASPLGVPKLTGPMYNALLVFAVLVAGAHALRWVL